MVAQSESNRVLRTYGYITFGVPYGGTSNVDGNISVTYSSPYTATRLYLHQNIWRAHMSPP